MPLLLPNASPNVPIEARRDHAAPLAARYLVAVRPADQPHGSEGPTGVPAPCPQLFDLRWPAPTRPWGIAAATVAIVWTMVGALVSFAPPAEALTVGEAEERVEVARTHLADSHAAVREAEAAIVDAQADLGDLQADELRCV